MKFARMNPHFLAEQLAQLMCDKRVIDTDGTRLGASAVYVTPVSEFGKSGDRGPVQINVAMFPFPKEFASRLEVFVVDAPEHFGTVSGTIYLIPAAHLKHVA